MKSTTLIFIFIISIASVQAKKLIYPLEVVAGMADLIVIGEIENVNANSYTFKVSDTFKGEIKETISVEKFKEWTCDTRFAPYEKGQRLCLFLEKGIDNWTIINGSTGEKPILKEKIHIGYDFDDANLSFSEFRTGMIEFCKCYELVGNYASYHARFKQLCTDNFVMSFKNTNRFTAWLYERITHYEIIAYNE